MTRGCQLHGLAPRGGAGIKHSPSGLGDQAGGERGSKILNPPPAFIEARQIGYGTVVIDPAMARSELSALAERFAGFVARKAKIQWRTVGNRAPGSLHDFVPPSAPPARFDLLGKARLIDLRHALAQQCAEDAMDQ